MSDIESFDLEENINFLINSNINEEIADQKKYLDSSIINNNFEIIEDKLNKCYEKFRVLEDVINYSKTYINNEINQIINECRTTIKEVENMNDLYSKTFDNYVLVNISLINNDNEQFTDRDNTIIPKCGINNKSLTIASDINGIATINNISILRNEQNFYNNESELILNNPYRTEYSLDHMNENGVEEIISINFKEVCPINTLKIKTSNCDIEHIVYVYENNKEIINEDITNEFFPTVKIKAIKIPIVCRNYTIEEYDSETKVDTSFEGM